MRTIYERRESERTSTLTVMATDRDDKVVMIHDMATASGHMYDVIELSESEVIVLNDALTKWVKRNHDDRD